MASPLRTIYWNANGLKNKVALLRAVLREQDIDVALICETLLTPSIRLNIPGYHVYRLDHTPVEHMAKRGLAVLVRRRLVHQVLAPPNTASFRAHGVELLIAGRPHRLFAVYRPPRETLNLGDIHKVLAGDTPTVMAGDWNAKSPAWHTSHSCPAGRKLLHDAATKGYDVTGPGAPTHYPFCSTHTPSVIDIVVSSGLQRQPALETFWDAMGSDHLPVLALFYPNAVTHLRPPERKRIHWCKFQDHLSSNTPTRPVSTAADVDSLAQELTTRIGETLTDATETTQAGTTKPPLPPKLRQLLETKRRTRRKWQVTRCPTLKAQLNCLTHKVRMELFAIATEDWDRRIEAASESSTSAHQLCRQLTRTPAPINPLLHADGNLRYRAEDRAEILADHLEHQFQPFDPYDRAHSEDIERRVKEYFAAPMSPHDPIFFSPAMVKKAILRTKPRKAPGVDGITNAALRHLPRPTIAAVTRLYNGILRTGHFPGVWKTGIVITIPKPGKNTTKPGSYRPITLLPTMSKIFEALLLKNINECFKPRAEQFGFRAEHSTTQQLARVLHLLTTAKNKKEKAVAIFLDMEKAFDRVWHSGLLFKIIFTTSTPPPIPHIIHSFLENRNFRVKVDSAISSPRPIKAGVPQGSCLSPVLYSCFTDDIPAPDEVSLALYADDAAYVATSLNHKHAAVKIQRALNLLPDWLQNWRMSANAQKTQAICVGLHHDKQAPPPLTLLGENVPWCKTVTYLGVTIDQGLTMKAHTKKIANQTRAATFALRPVLKSDLPLRTKLGIYKTYVRSRLTYAAPAWYALAAESSKKPLRAQQNIALRLIVNAPRYVRNSTISRDLRIETIDQFVVRLARKMFCRADASVHGHLRNIAPLHARPPDRKAYPRDLLVRDCSNHTT